jgi:hypothetical protein
MNKFKNVSGLLFLFSFFLVFASSHVALANDNDTLVSRLRDLPGVNKVESMATKHFNNKYVLYVEQPLDHVNPEAGTFLQRVFLMNVSFDRPTVLVTEGYGAGYVRAPFYREEISSVLDANIVFVEHRYFLESTPENAGWEYLTARNSAYDLHRVREMFGEFYKGKWIATGISKGGQTALLYTAFFPEDVDITVPYVAPLCSGVEDGRHEPFLREKTGTQEQRDKLQAFQNEVLMRRPELQKKFDSLCTVKSYEFNLPTSQIYDYSVLEFPFAFWQWGSDLEEVPAPGSSATEVFNYWMKISSPDYFQKESDTTPFFVQAAKELGYYGYDTKPFEGLLKIDSADGYLEKIFLPKGTDFNFDDALYKRLKAFVDTTSSKMMFIYGEYDPWSAVMVDEPNSNNVVLFIDPKGSHRARISTLPEDMQKQAVGLLRKWLDE